MSRNTEYSKQDCIEALEQAAEELGKSPTSIEYRSLDIYPTYSTFYKKFGSWNEAKEAANLEQYTTGRSYSKKPEMIEMSEDEWENLKPHKRHRIRRTTRLQRIKLIAGCNRCNFNEHPSALEFHHKDKSLKSFDITREFLTGSRSWKEVANEIKKCEILCSNCHRMEESDWPY